MTTTFPMQFAVPDDNKVANWRPLAHWAMAIPHLIVAYVVSAVAAIVAFVAWFAILFTGRMPEGMANLIVMMLRYNARAGGYLLGLSETYPPFTFDTVGEDPGDYDITLSVQSALEDRNRVTVLFRIIMMIPLVIVGYVWEIIAAIVAIVAWFAVLFTGVYPEGLRRITVGFMRFYNRMSVYGMLLTDEYPSFSLTE
ncbi:MAG: DUF4389 domain-containing protein [Actinomycetota bacterium]|jgi:hypothetical protein|nr:DUF4389 domain-containing protein [Actinomycetota bacterium]